MKVLPSGVYQYRFVVDGRRRYAPDLPWAQDDAGNAYNVLDLQVLFYVDIFSMLTNLICEMVIICLLIQLTIFVLRKGGCFWYQTYMLRSINIYTSYMSITFHYLGVRCTFFSFETWKYETFVHFHICFGAGGTHFGLIHPDHWIFYPGCLLLFTYFTLFDQISLILQELRFICMWSKIISGTYFSVSQDIQPMPSHNCSHLLFILTCEWKIARLVLVKW